jgi:hypothetical protein
MRLEERGGSSLVKLTRERQGDAVIPTAAEPLHVFPDTNVLLHFERPDQIDWSQVTADASVVLVLAPVVLRELDRHKNEGRVRRLQDRARDLSTWLRGLRKSKGYDLVNGSRLEIAIQESQDFYGHGLSSDVPDDRLIACALDYSAQGRRVAIGTDDTLLLHKLDAYGIEAVELPVALRRKAEPDPVETENRQLKQKLAAIESRAPALHLRWQGGGTEASFTVRPLDMSDIASPEAERNLHPHLLKRSERPPGLAGVGAIYLGSLPDDSVDRHNDRLTRYWQEYAGYFSKARSVRDWHRRHVKASFRLSNEGTASAKSVLVRMSFPIELRPILESDAEGPDMPEAPKPPSPPSAFGLIAPAGMSVPMHDWALAERLRRSIQYEPESYEVTGQRVTFRFDRALAGHDELLAPVHFLVSDGAPDSTLQIDVDVFAEELSASSRQTLSLTIAYS